MKQTERLCALIPGESHCHDTKAEHVVLPKTIALKQAYEDYEHFLIVRDNRFRFVSFGNWLIKSKNARFATDDEIEEFTQD